MRKIVIIVWIAFLSNSCKDSNNSSQTSTSDTLLSGVFSIDKSSTLFWKGSKPTGSHNGTIRLKDGEFILEKGKITQGKFVIDMTSITVLDLEGNDKISLENHLKGANKLEDADHFFNVKKFPEAVFEFTSYTKINNNELMEGNLIVKGKTNKIQFPVLINEKAGAIVLTSPPFSINRTLWNITYGSKSFFDNLGDTYINDDIEIELSIKGIKNN